MKPSKFVFLLLFMNLLIGCSSTSVIKGTKGVDDENFETRYSVGQSYLTTRTLVTEEETPEGKLAVYKYDRYFTVIDALDSENTPVAGRRVYEESFFEITGKRNLKGDGVFQEKTIIFKPDNPPTVEGNTVDEKYTAGLRLTGFEHVFLPDKALIDGKFHPVEMIESKKRIMKAFLTELGIIPDDSVISAKIVENSEQFVKFQFIWHVSGIILGNKGVGVKLNFEGQIIYSKTHKGITYFELVRKPLETEKSKLRLIINRDFNKKYKFED